MTTAVVISSIDTDYEHRIFAERIGRKSLYMAAEGGAHVNKERRDGRVRFGAPHRCEEQDELVMALRRVVSSRTRHQKR